DDWFIPNFRPSCHQCVNESFFFSLAFELNSLITRKIAKPKSHFALTEREIDSSVGTSEVEILRWDDVEFAIIDLNGTDDRIPSIRFIPTKNNFKKLSPKLCQGFDNRRILKCTSSPPEVPDGKGTALPFPL